MQYTSVKVLAWKIKRAGEREKTVWREVIPESPVEKGPMGRGTLMQLMNADAPEVVFGRIVKSVPGRPLRLPGNSEVSVVRLYGLKDDGPQNPAATYTGKRARKKVYCDKDEVFTIGYVVVDKTHLK